MSDEKTQIRRGTHAECRRKKTSVQAIELLPDGLDFFLIMWFYEI